MSRTVVMPRKVYEVKSKVTDPIRLYLDTGIQRHINPGDTVLLLGETAGRVGLDREMHRGRVDFREFNIVMPETTDPQVAESKLFQDSLKQYEGVMKHLFSGNVLYLDSNGAISEGPPPAAAEVVAPKVDDSEQVEKLEKAVKQPDLKIVKDETPSAEEEFSAEDDTEILLDDEEEDAEVSEDGEDAEKPEPAKTGKSRKKGRKKSKK